MVWVHIWSQGKLELSEDPELVWAESWGPDPHLHILPRASSIHHTNMVIIAALAVFGAVAIIGAMVAFMMKMRRNTGKKGQSLSFPSAPFRSVLCSSKGKHSHTNHCYCL